MQALSMSVFNKTILLADYRSVPRPVNVLVLPVWKEYKHGKYELSRITVSNTIHFRPVLGNTDYCNSYPVLLKRWEYPGFMRLESRNWAKRFPELNNRLERNAGAPHNW